MSTVGCTFSGSRCKPAGFQVHSLITCPSPDACNVSAVRDGRGCGGAGPRVHSAKHKWMLLVRASILAALYTHRQAKTSVSIIGSVTQKRGAEVVESSFKWTDDFYERIQITLKPFLEFKNRPSYLYWHCWCVFFLKWRFMWRHLLAGPKILLIQPAWNFFFFKKKKV